MKPLSDVEHGGRTKQSGQDWIWTFVWPIVAIFAGAEMLRELLFTNQYHPWGPLLGLGASVVALLTWWAIKGPAKVILGVLAVLGTLLNIVAGVLVIIFLTH